MARFLLSSAIGDERIPTFKTNELAFGHAHYSWKIVADLYREGLRAAGHDVINLQAPDAYQTPQAMQIAGLSPNDISLIIKPIEFIRPSFDHRNIAICGWEFPEFSQHDHNGDPRTNHVAMLKSVDQVWCWSNFTTNNLLRHGVNARRLPPPALHDTEKSRESVSEIPCASLDSIKCSKATEALGDVYGRFEGSKYLTVLNPFDKRKGIVAELEGAVAGLEPEDLLIVKLVIDNIGTTVENTNRILDIHYGLRLQSPNVVFIGAYLSVEQLNGLYALCDSYLCCSSAEGLNLPLISAMENRLLAISTSQSAMNDYISDETAVRINSSQCSTGEAFHSASNYLSTTHFPTDASSVRQAIRRAKSLSSSQRKQIIGNGFRKVSGLYGMKRFAKDVADVIEAR